MWKKRANRGFENRFTAHTHSYQSFFPAYTSALALSPIHTFAHTHLLSTQKCFKRTTINVRTVFHFSDWHERERKKERERERESFWCVWLCCFVVGYFVSGEFVVEILFFFFFFFECKRRNTSENVALPPATAV